MKRIGIRASSLGASPTTGRAHIMIRPKMVSVRALPRVSTKRPVVGKATIAPAARAIRAVPTWPVLRSCVSLIEGMREIHEESVSPLTRKIAAIPGAHPAEPAATSRSSSRIQ